jgi:hypothetical protein
VIQEDGSLSNDIKGPFISFFFFIISYIFIMIFSTIGCILLTPLILLVIVFLTCLAVITSTITSSFIFLRLALLAIEMVSGLTIESTNWLLSTCITRIRGYLHQYNKSHQRQEPAPLIKRTRKMPPSALSLSQLPYKATIKAKYSVSVPGTPEAEAFSPLISSNI